MFLLYAYVSCILVVYKSPDLSRHPDLSTTDFMIEETFRPENSAPREYNLPKQK